MKIIVAVLLARSQPQTGGLLFDFSLVVPGD